MSGAPSRRVYDLLAEARAKDGPARDAFLDDVCAGNDALRTEIDALLAVAEETGHRFLERPAMESLQAWEEEKPPLEPGARVGPYQIERLLGHGGDGVVYQARQRRPRRRVALKIPRARLVSESTLRRFEAETDHLGRLHHPGIAQIYDVGVHEGEAYFALELIEDARTITAYVEERDAPVAERIELVAQVCDALQHAHERGLLHRDIKPANVLVTPEGRPKVVDFGIAVVQDLEDEPEAAAGTRPYMSPEQLNPSLDVRTDVFGLGVLLYEVLTGRLPPREGMGTDRNPALDALPRRWRGDLSAIVGKALRRDRERRYASAADLAADLRRCVRSEPVMARDNGIASRVVCAVRRYRTACVAGSVVLLAVLAATAYGLVAAARIDDFHRVRQRVRSEARWVAYRTAIATAQAALLNHRRGDAVCALESAPTEHRSWEWRYLWRKAGQHTRVLRPEGYTLRAGVVSDSGRLAAAEARGSSANTVRIAIYDLESASLLHLIPTKGKVTALVFSPDETVVWSGDRSGWLQAHRVESGKLVARRQLHQDSLNDIEVDSISGRILTASSDGTIGVWSLDALAPLGHLSRGTDRVICLDMAPDGRLAAGSRDGVIDIWDLEAREVVKRLEGHTSSVESVAWSPDGRRLSSGSRDKTVRLWDAETGAGLSVRDDHGATVRVVAFSPDGETFASGGWDRTIRFWRTSDGRLIETHSDYHTLLISMAFLDSQELLSFNGGMRRIRAPRAVDPYSAHEDLASHLTWSPDGRFLATAAIDGSVAIWDVAADERVAVVGGDHRCVGLGFNTRGVLRLAQDSFVLEFDGTMRKQGQLDPSNPGAAWFGSDTIVASYYAGLVRTFDAVTLERRRTWVLPGTRARVLTVAPETDIVATGHDDGTVFVWRLTTGARLARFNTTGWRVYGLSISRDGRLLASASRDGCSLFNVGELNVSHVLGRKTDGWQHDVAFSGDSRRIASAGGDGMIRIWDVATGDLVLAIRGHVEYGIRQLEFSPDGNTLAYVCGYNEVKQLVRFLRAVPESEADGAAK